MLRFFFVKAGVECLNEFNIEYLLKKSRVGERQVVE